MKENVIVLKNFYKDYEENVEKQITSRRNSDTINQFSIVLNYEFWTNMSRRFLKYGRTRYWDSQNENGNDKMKGNEWNLRNRRKRAKKYKNRGV